jgi:hypothetical protein
MEILIRCSVTKNENFMEKIGIQSLIDRDSWRSTLELSNIGTYLKVSIEAYFQNKDISVHIPDRVVIIKSYPVDLRMALISTGKSDPYKVFFRITPRNVEIFLILHPRQKLL